MVENRSTVFVVDDEPSVCRAIQRLIRLNEMNVQTFPSAQAFLKATLPDFPACLVLDVCMPGLNGLELQQYLNTMDFDLPIIFITGHGDIPTSVRAMKAGALEFLTKPFRGRDLIEAVRRGVEVHTCRIEERKHTSELQRLYQTLTSRERQVFELVTDGLSNKEISDKLGPRLKTVKIHRARVMEKMRARSLAHLVKISEKLRVVSSPTLPNRP